MDVVINSDCSIIPDDSIQLTSQGSGILNFLCSLGYDSQKPPIADLLRSYYKLTGSWVIVSPIHWHATHNDALILAIGNEIDITESDIQHYFHLFAEYLIEAGLQLHYHDQDCWLLNADTQPHLHAKPVYQLRNKSLMPELEQLDASMYWQKFITESQMFFATQSNTPAINGIWAWGAGSLIERGNISVCADETFYDLAAICSSKVVQYTPDVSLNEFRIILLNNKDILTEQHKKDLSKKHVNWFWNNTAYTLNGSNWLARLWRNVINAH